MATKKETKKAEAKPKEAKPKKAEKKAPGPIPEPPLADDQAVVGAFVEVVKGDHKGRYGLLMEAHSLDTAIVRTRDSASERIVTKYTDLIPAEAGRR
jgi:hypothetical protein